MFAHSAKNAKEQEAKKLELKNFLDNSYEYNQIKELAKMPHLKRLENFIANIENCDELSDILYDTNDFDFERTDNIMLLNLGRNKTNAILFVAGFFSDYPNVGYYVLHFREKVIDELKKQRGKDYDPGVDSWIIPAKHPSR